MPDPNDDFQSVIDKFQVKAQTPAEQAAAASQGNSDQLAQLQEQLQESQRQRLMQESQLKDLTGQIRSLTEQLKTPPVQENQGMSTEDVMKMFSQMMSQQNGGKDPNAFSKEEIDNLGPDTMGAIEKAKAQVRSEQEAIINELRGNQQKMMEALKGYQEQFDNRLGANAAQAINVAVQAAIPDLGQLEMDPNFTKWMKEIEPFSGQPRETLFDIHKDTGNVKQMAHVVNQFRAEQNAAAEAAGSGQPQQQNLVSNQMPDNVTPIGGTRSSTVGMTGTTDTGLDMTAMNKAAEDALARFEQAPTPENLERLNFIDTEVSKRLEGQDVSALQAKG